MNEESVPNPVDMIEQAGEILANFVAGELLPYTADPDKRGTVVLASAVLAVAAELREVRNVLHEINMKMAERAKR